jgi:hypothetical protein
MASGQGAETEEAQRQSPILSLLVSELRAHVVRHGLPVRVPKTRSPIFELRCVTAHAISDDLLDRATALDGIIRRILGHHFGGGPDGEPAYVLFALAKGTKGMSLTQRRERCAELRGVHPDHWRKHLEPKLIEGVAYELHLLDRHYVPRLAETAPYRPSLEYPDLSSSGLLRDELESHILARMYAYRANVVGLYIAVKYDVTRDREEYSDLALWEFTQLTLAASRYIDEYGEKLVFLGRDDNITGLLRIAGWFPPFTKREANWLGLAFTRAPEPTVGSFLETLCSTEVGRQIRSKWREQLEEAAERANVP